MNDESAILDQDQPHPLNVPGDFYVLDGCCTMCGVPFQEAPDLFGQLDGHCFVKQQPAYADQYDQMIEVFRRQELRCIRYRGTDRYVQRRIAELGEGPQCDHLPDDLHELSAKVRSERDRPRVLPLLLAGAIVLFGAAMILAALYYLLFKVILLQ